MTDEHGNQVKFGKQIGNRGGEGCVFEVEGNQQLVAKIYHIPPDKLQVEKLHAQKLLSCKPIENIAAWPKGLLIENGKVVGFLMPRCDGKPIHLLYRPADRVAHFPDANWNNLAAVARNLAAAFDTLHRHSIIMADVNESNVLIDGSGQIKLIDCDSYQLFHSGKTFMCSVGTAIWSAPELQGISSFHVIRNLNHDNFGLAVLIFHLLFMGVHPFAGVPKIIDPDGDTPALEFNIRNLRFAASRKALPDLLPPKNLLPLASVTDPLAQLFEQAFLSRDRPTASIWHAALSNLKFSLCRFGHSFLPAASFSGQCPWCELWNNGGPNYFVVSAKMPRHNLPEDALKQILSHFGKLSLPLNLSYRPQVVLMYKAQSSINHITQIIIPKAKPSPFPKDLPKYRSAFALGLGFALFAVFSLILAPSVIWIWLIFGILGFLLLQGGSKNPLYVKAIQDRRQLPTQLEKEISYHLARNSQASQAFESKFNAMRAKTEMEMQSKIAAIKQDFDSKISSIKKIIQELEAQIKKFPELQAELKTTALKKSQLDAFLKRYRITDYKISQLGPVRIATLHSYGIINASDVQRKMGYIPRLGAATANLRSWASGIEKKFTFNSSLALMPDAELELNRDTGKKHEEIMRRISLVNSTLLGISRDFQKERVQSMVFDFAQTSNAKLESLNADRKREYENFRNELEEKTLRYAQGIADIKTTPDL